MFIFTTRHDIAEIVLKVALKTITPYPYLLEYKVAVYIFIKINKSKIYLPERTFSIAGYFNCRIITAGWLDAGNQNHTQNVLKLRQTIVSSAFVSKNKGSLFYLFLKLVQINYIFSDKVL